MQFEGDAFISYAHLDNVELVEGRKGWVANLHRALEVRVAQLLGKSPRIWRDPKLQGNDLFAETLIDRLRRVAVLVSVVSPRYVKSEWTLRELEEFWHAAELQGGIRVRDKARVFKVLKTPVALERTPPELRTILGYEFFKIDPETGKVRELDEVFGPEAQREFWLRLDDLAHDMCRLLEMLEDPTSADETTAPPGRPAAVFLAETTTDLREHRETIKRDLEQHGFTVLPDRVLPADATEVAATLRENLSRCRMSIHLVGKFYGVVPEGGSESLLEMQHELAVERAAAGGFSRLVWIAPGLQVTDDRQRAVIERLRLDPRCSENADLLETYLEDLRTVIQHELSRGPVMPVPRATPAAEAEPRVQATRPGATPALPATPPSGRPAAAVAAPPTVYVIHDQRDTDAVEPWIGALFDQHVEVVRPVFEGDEAEVREYHEENLTTCDGALIFYAAANEMWLRRKLREIQKAAGLGRSKPRAVVGICVLAPKTVEKERFRTHEALVIPQFDGVTPDGLQPFVARLLGADGGPRD